MPKKRGGLVREPGHRARKSEQRPESSAGAWGLSRDRLGGAPHRGGAHSALVALPPHGVEAPMAVIAAEHAAFLDSPEVVMVFGACPQNGCRPRWVYDVWRLGRCHGRRKRLVFPWPWSLRIWEMEHSPYAFQPTRKDGGCSRVVVVGRHRCRVYGWILTYSAFGG